MEYMESKMQQVFEASEHEYNELMDEFNPPDDWDNPKWDNYDKVCCWRNYANEGLKREWDQFTGRQKIMISAALQEVASNEHWE